jgi:hypothetical protein
MNFPPKKPLALAANDGAVGIFVPIAMQHSTAYSGVSLTYFMYVLFFMSREDKTKDRERDEKEKEEKRTGSLKHGACSCTCFRERGATQTKTVLSETPVPNAECLVC